MKPVLNVLELARVSTNKQDLERQEYDLADNRAEYNLNPLQQFLIKESGEKVLKTEDIERLVAELKRPGVDGVSVSAIDRIARPQDLVSIAFFQIFLDLKKVIVSKREGLVEPWTPRGRKILMAALTQASNELSDLKDRLLSNRRKMHAKKRMCNTTPPFGMVYVDRYHSFPAFVDGAWVSLEHPAAKGLSQVFIEDPIESSVAGLTKKQVVINVFNWRFFERMRPTTIQRRLNDLGILTSGKPGQYDPGPWSRDTVIQMLENRHYVGEHWEGDTMMPCPQFVSREVFDGVQQMFKEAKLTSNGRPPTKHLLCGKLKCKVCGRNYRTVTGSGRYPAYVCGNYNYKLRKQVCRANSQIRCHLIEPVVWGAIWAFLTQPELLLANAQQYYDSLPKDTGVSKLEQELDTLNGEIRRTRLMVKAGAYDEHQGTAEILQAMQRVREIEAELRAAGSVRTLPAEHLVRAACRRIADGPEPTRFETRRPILDKLVNLKITYDKGVAEMEGKVPVAETAHKCGSRIHGDHTYVHYIPFRFSAQVPGARVA